MDLWWVPIGLAAWFGVAVVAALCVGPALRRGSEAREALDQRLKDIPDEYEPFQDERQASPVSRGTGASGAQPSGGRPVSLRVPPPSDGAEPYTLKQNVRAAATDKSLCCLDPQKIQAERKMPGALRVLVAGQSAGSVERGGGAWIACWCAGMTASGSLRDRVIEHATAEEAAPAVVRSAWAQRLGARAASMITWSDRARRAARLTVVAR